MIMSQLEEKIKQAAVKAVASRENWQQKHIPIRVNGNLIWGTTEVPTDIQEVIDVIPKEKDTKDVKRPHQIKSRLSDEEMESFDTLLLASGLSQTDYIRGMVLNGRVNITQTSLVDAQSLDTLAALSADLGRIAGMIRQTVIVNKEFSVLTPESKDQLEAQLRRLRHLQTYIQRVAEELYGHL